MEKYKDQTQEINQNENTKPGLDYAGVTPLSSIYIMQPYLVVTDHCVCWFAVSFP